MEVSKQYLELYKLLHTVMEEDVPGDTLRICVYNPESYIALADEVLRLRAEATRLQQIEAQYALQCHYALGLEDKIRLAKKLLDQQGIKLRMRW